ncbi:MAG TPA: hypothetical protein VFQ60_00940 [Patescibacteria group bacterium]|nr:hypothetical protein [Patescibacteria group bacterium]
MRRTHGEMREVFARLVGQTQAIESLLVCSGGPKEIVKKFISETMDMLHREFGITRISPLSRNLDASFSDLVLQANTPLWTLARIFLYEKRHRADHEDWILAPESERLIVEIYHDYGRALEFQDR